MSSTLVQLVPIKINYSGPAKVSSYFRTAEVKDNGGNEVQYEASFRGRKLSGTKYVFPANVKGYLLEKKVEVNAEDETSKKTHLTVKSEFNEVFEWMRDKDISPEKRIKSFLEFSSIARTLHEASTSEDIEKSNQNKKRPVSSLAEDSTVNNHMETDQKKETEEHEAKKLKTDNLKEEPTSTTTSNEQT
eukprot:TRINITY_DN13990_c0_g1_i1.p1 TRINITY_DN13990_c0_g1~~TRINITY_DN13990_c0_g1_i1.p1  ORF type:complete len:210 (+),score=51.86 TRINITY_DN13990_c0_g1_i1:66-632(+)